MRELKGIRNRVALVSGAGPGCSRRDRRHTHRVRRERPNGSRRGIAAIETAHGTVSLLACNHAYMTMAPFLETGAEEFERHLRINLVGTALLIQRCLPAMRAQGYGRIVAMTSEWGVIGWPNAASKGGLIALVKGVARAYAREGISANLVAPGTSDTPQLDVDAIDAGLTHEEMVAVYAKDSPMQRINWPEDPAAAVAFLLSEPAIALTGQILSPNGGTTRL